VDNKQYDAELQSRQQSVCLFPEHEGDHKKSDQENESGTTTNTVAIPATGEDHAIRQAVETLQSRSGPAQPYTDLPECNICWEKYDDGAKIPLTMSCGHCICGARMMRLSGLSCPHCRRPIQSVLRLHM
jgi:hypothetical protein